MASWFYHVRTCTFKHLQVYLGTLELNRMGVSVYDSNPYIQGNDVKNGNTVGISVSNSTSIIEGNTINTNTKGISLNGTSTGTNSTNTTTILDNTLDGNERGIESNGSGGLARGNTIKNHTDSGIHCNDSSLDIQDNTISGNSRGIHTQENSNATTVNISGNYFDGNDRGVFCDANSSVRMKSATFTGNNKSVFIQRTNRTNISDSNFHSNKIGFDVREANATVTYSSFVGNRHDYRTDAGSNLTLQDCYYSYSNGNVSWSYEVREFDVPRNRFDYRFRDMSVGDVNNDTYDDIVYVESDTFDGTTWYYDLVILTYNSTSKNFDEKLDKDLYYDNDLEFDVLTENIDDDYEDEIILSAYNVTIYDWTESGWTEADYSPVGAASAHYEIAAGDVNNDTHPDLVTYTEPNNVRIYLWDDVNGEFIDDPPTDLPTVTECHGLFVNDTDHDGKNDIIVAGTDQIAFHNQSEGGFGAPYYMEFENDGRSDHMLVADIDGDAKEDQIRAVYRGDPDEERTLVARTWNDSASAFDEPFNLSGQTEHAIDGLYFYDTDADGDKEIVGTVNNYFDSKLAVFENDGSHANLTNEFGDLGAEVYALEPCNINGDPYNDVVAAGDGMSKLLWNDSHSSTNRNVRIEVRNDTDAGVNNATVTLTNGEDLEVFNHTTNGTGFTPVGKVTIVKKNLTDEKRYPTFELKVAQEVGATTYEITEFVNITSFTSIYEHRIYIGNDTDNDGITDGRETYVYGSNISNSDTDNDGIEDGIEAGVNNTTKPSTTGEGFIADADVTTTTSLIYNDTDNDSLQDGLEDANQNGKLNNGETDPNSGDTDDDDLPDGWFDYDGDGEKDPGEYEDMDLDGAVDGGVWGEGGETDPLDNDTDGGGVEDGVEVIDGTDPLDGSDDEGATRGETRGRTRSGGGGGGQIAEEIVIGEVGTFTIPAKTIQFEDYDGWAGNKDMWTEVELQAKYQNPIVIVSPVSWDTDMGKDPLVACVKVENYDVDDQIGMFEIRLTKRSYWLERSNPDFPEVRMRYLVIEEGEHIIGGEDGTEEMRVKAGRAELERSSATVDFDDYFEEKPLVLTQG